MHARIHTRSHTRIHVHTHTRTRTRAHTHTRTHAHTHTRTHAHTHTRTHAHTHTRTHAHTHTRTHAHTHTRTHAHTHTRDREVFPTSVVPVQLMDDLTWAQNAVREMEYQCLTTAMGETDGTSSASHTSPRAILKYMCPNQCSARGRCVNGECICNGGDCR